MKKKLIEKNSAVFASAAAAPRAMTTNTKHKVTMTGVNIWIEYVYERDVGRFLSSQPLIDKWIAVLRLA